MNLFKNISFFLFLLFLLIGISEVVVGYSINIFSDICFALSFNLLLSSFMYPIDLFVKYSLPIKYFKINGFEKDGTIYRAIGILKAKKIYSRSHTIKFSGKRVDLDNLAKKMMLAEKHHFFAFITLLGVVIYSLLRLRWYFSSALLIFAVLLHGFPVMIQRYNRARLIMANEKHIKPLKNDAERGAF